MFLFFWVIGMHGVGTVNKFQSFDIFRYDKNAVTPIKHERNYNNNKKNVFISFCHCFTHNFLNLGCPRRPRRPRPVRQAPLGRPWQHQGQRGAGGHQPGVPLHLAQRGKVLRCRLYTIF